MSTVIPALSMIVAFVFALAVFDQFLARRQPYQLVWAVGLLVYSGATACEFVIGAFGLSAAPYRLWYLLGAVFAAAWLGMGTIYLLASRKVADIVLGVLLGASAIAVWRVLAAPLDLGALAPGAVLTGKAFPPGAAGPRILTPFFNTFGTVALVGGAAWSAWDYWRQRAPGYRVVSNVLVAVGAFLPALGGTFSRLGVPGLLYIFELLGIIVIFLGFLRSREVFGLYRIPFSGGLKPVLPAVGQASGQEPRQPQA